MPIKKTLSIVLSVVMLSLLMSLQVSAAGPLKSKTTFSCSSTISHSGTLATLNSKAVGDNSITKVSIKMELQKKSGSSYSTVKTWSSTTNSSSASMRKTAVVSSKATYRVKTTFTLYSNSGKETITKIAY